MFSYVRRSYMYYWPLYPQIRTYSSEYYSIVRPLSGVSGEWRVTRGERVSRISTFDTYVRKVIGHRTTRNPPVLCGEIAVYRGKDISLTHSWRA
jgi:hypothetical protein